MANRAVLLLSLVLVTTPKAWSADANDLVRVLQSGRCANCRLADADLVHTDLRDADLNGAELQRANLGQARLDGADQGQPLGGELASMDLHQHPEQCQLLKGFQWVIA